MSLHRVNKRSIIGEVTQNMAVKSVPFGICGLSRTTAADGSYPSVAFYHPPKVYSVCQISF